MCVGDFEKCEDLAQAPPILKHRSPESSPARLLQRAPPERKPRTHRPQQRLYFLPELQGHGSLRPTSSPVIRENMVGGAFAWQVSETPDPLKKGFVLTENAALVVQLA